MLHDALITSVVDGDTYDAIVDLDFDIKISIRIRLFGVNCPETKKKNKSGIDAKKFATELLQDKPVTIDYRRHDSFGRVLSCVWLDGSSVSDILVANGHAIIYVPHYLNKYV